MAAIINYEREAYPKVPILYVQRAAAALSFKKGLIGMDTCISCGKYVPEGRMVCPECEENGGPKNYAINDCEGVTQYDKRQTNNNICGRQP
jgi:uncharacterized OB-fold protein